MTIVTCSHPEFQGLLCCSSVSYAITGVTIFKQIWFDVGTQQQLQKSKSPNAFSPTNDPAQEMWIFLLKKYSSEYLAFKNKVWFWKTQLFGFV